ncbi:response regulator transcription factor [Spirochaeta thermophila]|uniref:response regulator transcription factor n=1 Tax=Winmispira thermophila TaxID=154 RepID=UPI0002EE8C4E|nr:winged helix-turn-helix domain-containing protein [Spirochaeta thermophila]
MIPRGREIPIGVFLPDADVRYYFWLDYKDFPHPQKEDIVILEDVVEEAKCCQVVSLPWKDFLSISLETGEGGPVWIPYGPADYVAQAFALGCGDYLKEPWSVGELLVRARRFLPQRVVLRGKVCEYRNGVLRREGKEVRLTPVQGQLFSLLVRHRGKPLGREALSHAVGMRNGSSRAVDMHVSLLRKKLAELDLEGVLVSVIRKGYMLIDEDR